MDNQPLITVIVPVYNIDEYIGRCIESIINQTYKKLEIILVDDGSTDNSGKICDDFADRDCRIKVLHKQNGGPSDARNVAIDIANGVLLTFVDGDDFLTPFCIESLWRVKENSGAQIACCWYKSVRDGKIFSVPECNGEVPLDSKTCVFTRVEALDKMLRKSEIDVSPFAKLYDVDLFDNVRYPQGFFCEDVATTYKLFAEADKVVLLRIVGYMYLIRSGSTQHSRFSKKKAVEIKFAREQKQYLDDRFTELISATADSLVSSCFHVLFGIYGQSDGKTEFATERKEAELIIRVNRAKLIKDKNTSKKTRLGCLLSYLGFNVTYFVYKLFGIRGRMIS